MTSKLLYVALGDSSAVGVGSSTGRGYPERLHARLVDGGMDIGLRNLGVSGGVVADVRRAVERAVALQPSVVTLGIGINDVWRGTSLTRFEADYDAVAKALASTGAPVVATNLPDLLLAPIAAFFGDPGHARRIADMNGVIGAAAKRHGVTLVDLFSLSRAVLPTTPDFFCADGFHPSEHGYALWTDMLWPTFREAIPQPPRGGSAPDVRHCS